MAQRPSGLTDDEITALRTLRTTFTTNLVAAYEGLADAIPYTDDNADDYINYFWDRLNAMWASHTLAVAYLLGVNPFNNAGGDYGPYETQAATPSGRASHVTSGKDNITNAAFIATQISDSYANLPGEGWYAAMNQNFKDGMLAVTTQATAARTALLGINSALTYLNARNLLWFPMAFGPHGNWVSATNLMTFALITLRSSFDDAASRGLRNAFNIRAIPETQWSAGSLTQFANAVRTITADIAPRMYNALYNWCLIPLTANQSDFSPMHLVGRSAEQVLLGCDDCSTTPAEHDGPIIGAPFYYTDQWDTWNTAWRSDLAARPTAWAKLDRFRFDFVSSWRDMDGATNALFAFPTESTLNTLRKQPNIPRNDPQWEGPLSGV